MKKIIFIIFIVIIALLLGYLIDQNSGYVMVSYDRWVVATSLWVAAASCLIAFFIIYFLLRFVAGIFNIPRNLRRRRQNKRAQKYRQYMMLGINALISNDQKRIGKAQQYFFKLKKLGLVTEEEFKQLEQLR